MRRVFIVMLVLSLALFASVSVAFAALDTVHTPGGESQNPASDSSLMETDDPGDYDPLDPGADGCSCHFEVLDQVNSAHGLYTRPVETTVDDASRNPYFADLPGDATFDLDPLQPNGVDWVFGGLNVGAERYIHDETIDIGGTDVTYPRVGNYQWWMDYPEQQRIGSPMLTISSPWQSYTPKNYFTGTPNVTETATDYGCIRCHTFNPEVELDGDGLPTGYTVEEWGVTCANCHSRPGAAAHGRGVFYSGGQCDMCHQRNPVPADPDEGVDGRVQQLDQRIWDTGQSGRHRDQGFDMNKPKVDGGDPIPGSVESTGGAGHGLSWDAVVGVTFPPTTLEDRRSCARCHSSEGYIAHLEEDVEVPYFWDTTVFGLDVRREVDVENLSGVSCVTCHTSHGAQNELDVTGMREPDMYEQCADCHRSQQLAMLETTSDDTKIDYNDSRVSHPTREMFEGRGGYGAENEPSLHLLVGAYCQVCHMPMSTGGPEYDSSHLFKTVMPEITLDGVTVGQRNITPLGVTTTTDKAFPDGSCTGSGCHLETDSTRTWLQGIIETRQTAIIDRVDAVEAKLDSLEPMFSEDEMWMKARTNLKIVINDGSWGIHNYYYARDLLNWSDTTLNSLMESDGMSAHPVARASGADRYATAIAASVEAFPDDSVTDVVIASGEGFPDALAASGLAGAVNSPVLLTRSSSLPSGLVAELTRLGADTVHIAGGTSAVSAGVSTALTTAGFAVERYGGINRYDTAALLAEKIEEIQGVAFEGTAFVVRGDGFADALAVGPFAHGQGFPVLLTPVTSLADETGDTIEALGIDAIVIAGGTSAVSEPVRTALQALSSSPVVTRVSGANRYETATAVVTYGVSQMWASYTEVGVASGETFPDALGGGAVMGAKGGVMVLTRPTALPIETSSFLTLHAGAGHIDGAVVFGGTAAVSDTVRIAVYDLLN